MKVLVSIFTLVFILGCNDSSSTERVTKCVSVCSGADEIESLERMFTWEPKLTRCVCTFHDKYGEGGTRR